MATWKKVIVSGSSANLANVQVDSLTNGQVVIGGGSGNLTTTALNGTGNIVATTNATNLDHSGSFSGSFEGDGSQLTGIQADTLANSIVDGNGIVDFTFNGSAGASVAVQADSTTGGDIKPVSVGANGVGFDVSAIAGDALSTDGDGVIDVDVDGSTIEIDGTSLGVVDGGIGTTQLANDSVTTDKIAHSLGTIGVHQFTGSFSGSFVGTTDLPDLTDGNGIADFTYDGSSAASIAVQADSTTGGNNKPVTVGANGVSFDISTIDGAGVGVSGGELVVNVDDSSIEIDSDSLRVKASGVTNTMLANSSITIGDQVTSLGGSVLNNLTHSATGSFTGSFAGDGSGLTGIASALTVDGDSGTQDVNLLTDDLQVIGTSNEIETAVTKVGTDVKVTVGLPNDVTIGQDLTVSRDVLVTRNLTVQGTASFQHETNLDVTDRFIRLASGSSNNGDGGIIIQQNSDGTGEVFGFDNPTKRFGVSGSMNPADNSFTPDAFIATVVEGSANDPTAVITKYTKKGNIFIANNEDIYIYS